MIVVLISLMGSEVEHLHRCLFAICVPSLVNVSACLEHFLLAVFKCQVLRVVYIYILYILVDSRYILVLCQICNLKRFSPCVQFVYSYF